MVSTELVSARIARLLQVETGGNISYGGDYPQLFDIGDDAVLCVETVLCGVETTSQSCEFRW